MTSILIAILTAVVVSAVLSMESEYRVGFFKGVFCPLICAIGLASLIIYSFMGYKYIGAEYKASILNNEYGTHYTQEEIFYASSVIDVVRELDRKRVEINGDLITGK